MTKPAKRDSVTPVTDDRIRKLVAAAPPFTEEQKAKIRALVEQAPEPSQATLDRIAVLLTG